MQNNLLKHVLNLSKISKIALSHILILLLLTNLSYANGADMIGSKKPIKTSPKVEKKPVSPINVKGKVIDRVTGETLIGVSVKVKNTNIGTVTDVDGNFTFTALPDNAVLLVSYIGYDSIEVPVEGRSSMTISLQALAKGLNEVVVVGYGTQKKTSLTAAVSTINTSEIAKKPVVNLTNSLVGRASGIIVTQPSGEPGYDGSNIQIRGIGSIGGSQPLLIVDGVPRDFSRLDPNTVENISILKDAAAVAPYGVAGANGVILVTTKKGRLGKPSFTYNSYYGIQNPTKVPTFVGSYDYALLRNEANANDGQPAAYSADDIQKFKDHSDPDGHSDGHPLQQIIMKNRPITYNNVTLSGGAENVKYFASLGYTHQAGMWSTTYTDKYNGSLNLTANATKTTTVNLSVISYVEDNHFPSQSAGTIIGQAQRQAPTTPIYYSNGLWSGYIGQSLIGEIYHSGYQFNEKPTTNSQFSIDQKLPIKGLSIKGVVSYDASTEVDRIWQTPIPFYNVNTATTPYTYVAGIQGSQKSQFTENYFQTHSFTYQGFLTYQATFGKSDISALAVVESRNVKYEQFGGYRQNYNLNIDELNYGGPAAADETNQGYSNGQKQLGYVYRLGYAYDKKYLFEATGRYDGSYLFAPGHRFGFFPAFSAGWRLSEESFMKNITWIDNLKLRASWGQSGAYPVVGNVIQTYQYLSPYNAYGNSAVLAGQATQGLYEALQGNPNITWEKANKTDVGFEASLWKGALSIEADYFYEKRSNMLVSIGNSLPGEYGIGTGLVNGGIMSNHGVDLTITSSKRFSDDLRLDITGTFTFARNKLLQVYETSATYNNPNRRQTGRPINTPFGYQALGYFTAADFNADGTLKAGIPVPTFNATVHPGDIRYADLSGPNGKPDGKIDANDQTVIGHPNTPEIIYGLEPRLTWKNFDLDVLFQGSGNSSININNYFAFPFNASGSASQLVFDNHWTPATPNALYPRITGTPTSNNTQTSTWFERNDSYIRLKSFEVGYTFSNKLLHNAIQSLRVYVAGQNVINYIPHMKEIIDPENSGSNTNYYQQRVFSLGVNATF
ncbi:TonB-dependent receptor [Mucilaginibacter sp. BJC16-A38]|uniref:SusC/RagA family TonB-linked outer membrane protein n=1 Tax=Mucilaginibacter phenanthrenivorans TaxID=1234842 RepID=UPI002158334F|nr:TonB-dependent receptor [Mucilaginibacter phenanthrenivorans]MCR8560652.1 TonB-dependent receptor [Mucilaginibacter phenanthrenivorans]